MNDAITSGGIREEMGKVNTITYDKKLLGERINVLLKKRQCGTMEQLDKRNMIVYTGEKGLLAFNGFLSDFAYIEMLDHVTSLNEEEMKTLREMLKSSDLESKSMAKIIIDNNIHLTVEKNTP